MCSLAREYRASLLITSSTTTAVEVSRVLGVQPDRAWAVGDSITDHPGSGKHRNHGWKLRAPTTDSDDSESQTSALASILERLAPRLASLASDCKLEVVIAAYTRRARPFIGMSAETMRVFGGCGCSLNCDIYDLSGDELRAEG